LPVTLRPAREDDAAFLLRLYASTRSEELAQVGWDAAQQDAFVRMQFAAQTRHYRAHYPGARFDVIEYDGEPAGRLTVWRSPGELRVVDLALLPAFRGRGVGERLLRELCTEAASCALPLILHVERENPALRLYRRLGFVATGEEGIHLRLEWRAAPAQAKTAS